ncbi:unnamed protein product, partial [Allacma fusca]
SRSSRIFVIDKKPTEIAWLNEAHAAAFRDPNVVFHSADLITQSGCDTEFGDINEDVDYVINSASETTRLIPCISKIQFELPKLDMNDVMEEINDKNLGLRGVHPVVLQTLRCPLTSTATLFLHDT